jgi:hypothetical protein
MGWWSFGVLNGKKEQRTKRTKVCSINKFREEIVSDRKGLSQPACQSEHKEEEE